LNQNYRLSGIPKMSPRPRMENEKELVLGFGALMLFVVVAVPIKIWHTFYRKGAEGEPSHLT
uniref:hypothetical protein n=1 Tax=uncultured Sphingomonas sp. TaxID=158754 RepID=UPI0035CBF78D